MSFRRVLALLLAPWFLLLLSPSAFAQEGARL
jgi:hypothetical protein